MCVIGLAVNYPIMSANKGCTKLFYTYETTDKIYVHLHTDNLAGVIVTF